MVLVYLVSLFIASSILIETIGVWFRLIGAVNGESALGYSSHVRVATLGRFFILISAPILGSFTDKGAPASTVALIGVLVFTIVLVGLLINLKFDTRSHILYIYKKINNVAAQYDDSKFEKPRLITNKVIYMSMFSFLLTASGILVVNFIATLFPDKRAMIVQMSALVTMSGTIMHAFFIDPLLARSCDNDIHLARSTVQDFVLGRLFASALLIIIFMGLMIGIRYQ